jgi:hypothetical protein
MAAGPALASRVDDAGTLVSSPVVPMAWRQSVPGRRADHAVEAVVGVRVRLNLSTWTGRRIHLYMVLAPTPGRVVQASWRGSGQFLPGVLKSGERALVFSGVATSPALTETLELTVTTDGRTLESPAPLSFHFEAEPA